MMNPVQSPLLLIGVGGAGAGITRGIVRAYGPHIRTILLDTDARTGRSGDLPFTLLGGNRLAGRGTGGQSASARAAFQDDPALLDAQLENVRTAVIVTALGGGTGCGATGELLKRLHTLGIVTLLFATLPFAFEGEQRARAARTVTGTLEQNADVSVFLPLDRLAAGIDNMHEALRAGIDTLAAGVSLLWRLLERPGYISLDAERLRNVLTGCGRAHFATASAQGPDRADRVLAALAENQLLKRDEAASHVRSVLVGVLGGDDLRLGEVGAVANGLSAAFGPGAALELGTVNDEETFPQTLCVVLLVFDESATVTHKPAGGRAARHAPHEHTALGGNSRFHNSEKTIWNGEDLNIPTYVRRQLTLDR